MILQPDPESPVSTYLISADRARRRHRVVARVPHLATQSRVLDWSDPGCSYPWYVPFVSLLFIGFTQRQYFALRFGGYRSFAKSPRHFDVNLLHFWGR